MMFLKHRIFKTGKIHTGRIFTSHRHQHEKAACESSGKQLPVKVAFAEQFEEADAASWTHGFQIGVKVSFIFVCLLAYIVLGGAIFQYIEGENDFERRHAQRAILNFTTSTCYTPEQLHGILKSILEDFKVGIVELRGYETYFRWDLWGSWYFTATILSTIGYGNQAPATELGKIFCVFYGLVGIPLFLESISFFGQFIAYICAHVSRRFAPPSQTKGRREKAKLLLLRLLSAVFFVFFFFVGPAFVFVQMENWTFAESVYYAWISLSTVGLGDYVAGVHEFQPRLYKIGLVVWLFVGLSCVAYLLSHMQNHINMIADKLSRKLVCAMCRRRRAKVVPIGGQVKQTNKDEGEETVNAEFNSAKEAPAIKEAAGQEQAEILEEPFTDGSKADELAPH